jgi:alpha-L-rhamnosidase
VARFRVLAKDARMPQAFSGAATWIWSAEGAHRPRPDDGPYRTRYFRRVFTLPATLPAALSLVAHVSADTCYILLVNGREVVRGPAKGDITHQFYETVDLTAHLRGGANVIAALVQYQGDVWPHYQEGGCNVSRMTACPGFTFDATLVADGRTLEALHSDRRWRVLIDAAYRWQIVRDASNCVGLYEDLDCAALPWGWADPSYDDRSWPAALELGGATRVPGYGDAMIPHRLLPRITAPVPIADPEPLHGIYQVGGGLTWSDGLTVPPHRQVSIHIDAGTYRTAYPELLLSGGAGGSLTLHYAEALRSPDPAAGGALLKGRRDQRTGEVLGVCDIIRPDGPERRWQPLSWRSFRFVRLDIATGATPLTVHGLACRDTTALPVMRATFASSDPHHQAIGALCWRTLQCCAHDTYEDCPYYEQLQYAGDTQVQAMLSYYTAGESALARQFLHQFDWSRGADGLTRSRYPSRIPQTIPYWSLHWVLAVADYWQITGDRATLAELLPGVRAVCDHLLRRRHADGTIGRLDGWAVADWCPQWNTQEDGHGAPPGSARGACAFTNLMGIATWNAGLELHAAVGADPGQLHEAVARCTAATMERFFDARRGLFRDTPEGEIASAYTNVWAILARMPVDHGALAERIVHDRSLCTLTMFSEYFACRALSQAGRYDLVGADFTRWRDMLAWGFTTCPETVDFVHTRSDCHAWSATPLIEFGREILGVRPGAPGYAVIRIEPKPSGLSWARGAVPLPDGALVQVDWRMQDGRFTIRCQSPRGRRLELLLPDGSSAHAAEGGASEFSCAAPAAR